MKSKHAMASRAEFMIGAKPWMMGSQSPTTITSHEARSIREKEHTIWTSD